MGKQALLWVGIVVVMLIAVFGLIQVSNLANTSNSGQTQKATNLPPVTSSDIKSTTKQSKVTLIEYGDFQCPACKFEEASVEKLMQDFPPGQLTVIFRMFPLLQVHRYAMQSAEAAYAANLQGKFWQYKQLLYANQDTWANSNNPQQYFDAYAKKLGLNLSKFDKDTKAASTDKFINSQENAGISAGVNATPTFYLNGEKILNNPASYDEFKQIIQSKLSVK